MFPLFKRRSGRVREFGGWGATHIHKHGLSWHDRLGTPPRPPLLPAAVSNKQHSDKVFQFQFQFVYSQPIRIEAVRDQDPIYSRNPVNYSSKVEGVKLKDLKGGAVNP